LKEIETEYPRGKLPRGILSLDLEFLRSHIAETLRVSVVPQSTPGVPLGGIAKTNEELIQNNPQLVVELVLARLILVLTTPHSVVEKLSPKELIQQGFCDPVRLFVKQEPHSQEKVAAKRFRLIMSVSLIDQIVERILCSPQNEAEISNWTTCASKPGIGFSEDWQKNIIYSRIQRGEKFADTDVIGWDWKVQGWLMEMDAEARSNLIELDDQEECLRYRYHNAMRNMTHCFNQCIYALSDGRLIEKEAFALQASGRYNTSSTNSRMRVILAKLVGAAWAEAMGDDDVEAFVKWAKIAYDAFGFPLKSYNVHDPGDPFEFCSHIFSKEEKVKAFNTNWSRSFFRLLNNEPRSEFLEQFKMEMQDNPVEWRLCLNTLSKLGWGQQ
jgi:hypothetical protein